MKISVIDSDTINKARLILHSFMAVEPEYLAYKMELTTTEAEGILEAMGWLRKKKPWGMIVYHEFWPEEAKPSKKEPRYRMAFNTVISGKDADYVVTIFDKEMPITTWHFETWDAGNGAYKFIDVFLQYLNARE